MNRRVFVASIAVSLIVSSQAANSEPGSTCPVTLGSDRVFAAPWPQARTWYGSESLATILSDDGVWTTTKPGHRISVKVFWYSVGFEAGQETDLTVTVESLDGAPSSARVDRPTNAYGSALGAPTMLTGIDFPDAGCWRVIAEYKGQELTFVVETIELEAYREKYVDHRAKNSLRP
ncbi:MAG: hypothetical protein ACR2Q3_17505 [Woeseiaceae bacterium]